MTAATAPLPENALRELDYSQVDVARLIGELRQALPPVALLHDHEDMRPYECDGLRIYRQVPLAVALPGTEAEVAAVLKICHAAGVPVVARGAGTGLSGGQQQRLVIARAIAVNPEVILMDEPCSALDPIATAKIEELIDELRERYCIVIVTHSMAQAARVSQRTAFFHMGRLIETGDTEEIFTNPRERRTLDYITGRFG